MASLSGYNGYQQAGQVATAAGSATSAILPWVGPALTGVGLLSQLYGNYKAEQVAKQNYEAQMKQFEAEQAMMAEDRQRQAQATAVQQSYQGKSAADSDVNNRLARYQGYFRQIGY